MKKKVLLSIALITAGFLSAQAQNIITIPERLQRPNANFEYPNFEKPQSPSIKTSDSGQDWWEPDTINRFSVTDTLTPYLRDIFRYNSHGLLAEKTQQYPINNSLRNTSLYTYTYDSNNNVLTLLLQEGENNENYRLYTYTDDSIKNLQTTLVQRWENNSWVNSRLYTYIYDSNKNLQTTLEQIWGNNNSWVNDQLYTYIYDSNKNLLSQLYQYWGSNSWVNSVTYTCYYTYDSNNNLLSKESNVFLETYTYDSNNNILTYSQQIRQNNSWENYQLHTYTYDSNNNVSTLLRQFYWKNNSWSNTFIYTYTYDSNYNLLSILIERWTGNSWVNSEQHQWIYDENDNCISFVVLSWLNGNWQQLDRNNCNIYLYYNNMQSIFAWDECCKMTASYTKVSDMPTAIEPVATPEINDISIYPNPTTGELRIKNYELGIKNYELGIDNVEVFDIYGIKQLSIFNFQFSTQIDISHLPAGIYFVRITTEKGVITKKIVKR